MLSFRTILHPTDFSERSLCAYQLACSLARDHGGRVIVLHVSPPPTTHGEVVARRQPNHHEEVLREQLHQLHPPDGKTSVEHRLVEGEADTEILRAARELACDLIVMGTHGRTGLRRALMGSVAEQVIRLAPCPVLTVNTPFPQAAETGSSGPAAEPPKP
jgi:nucleotide-binding universal stress UspA family protein